MIDYHEEESRLDSPAGTRRPRFVRGMEIPTLVQVLDHAHIAAEQLDAWQIRDAHRARQALVEFAEGGLTLDLLAELCDQLARILPEVPDADAALEALRRFHRLVRSPLALAALFERDRKALPLLVRAFSLGLGWREVLIADPEAFDRLRMTGGQPVASEALARECCSEVGTLTDELSIAAALARFRSRELLRIAYGEVLLKQDLGIVAGQLTGLTEAVLEAALESAARLTRKGPVDTGRGDKPPKLAVIALDRFGGAEMDYGNEVELLLVHDPAAGAETATKNAIDAAERVGRCFLRLLGEPKDSDFALSVRLVSLPDSPSNVITHTADDTLLGFDSFGRTWHRQAMLKARGVAGDRRLASALLDRLQPWIYRRYLNRADETGITALRRRLGKRQGLAADAAPDLATVDRGSRDIEGVVAYLQLLVGGDQPAVRTASTLAALAALEQTEAISPQERGLLEESYRWLRRVTHRLQIQQNDLPTNRDRNSQLEQVARSLGEASGEQLAHQCRQQLGEVTDCLDRLLGSAAGDDRPSPVVDLLLDPAPTAASCSAALTGYGLTDPVAAAKALDELAREHNPFLSTRRCRHFLSLIADRLLQEMGLTPDPDRTLVDLVRISNSLGGKGMLWELFNSHPASLQLSVRLCAASPYLAGILTTNPGTIDDLVDSLQLDRLPNQAELDRSLAELSRGTSDIGPILLDLKNSAHLRIGVRDILGKDPIDATHAALADVAEFCLGQLIEREHQRLIEKPGQPTQSAGPFAGELCRPVVLGLGKLGGREPNYHSNLEIVFLYEAEGMTRPAPRSRQQATTNGHFFAQLAQRVLKASSELTPKGRLATIEAGLRLSGEGVAIAMPSGEFVNHFQGVGAPLGHWQALCQARPVFGEPPVRESTTNAIRQLLTSRVWRDGDRDELWSARLALEQGAAELNLKRASGGTLDVEFLVQLLQLRHAATCPAVLIPGTQKGLASLAANGLLARDDAEYFADSYRFLRRIESGLRLLNRAARHDMPEGALELNKLALLLGQPNGDTIRDRAIMILAENRRRCERIVAAV